MAAVEYHDNGDGNAFYLKCTQDADIWESIPDDHGGHISHKDRGPEGFLIVGKMPEYSRKRILIQFEDIPADYRHWSIKWAKMYLYFFKAHRASWHEPKQAPSISRELQVHQMLKSWNEEDVTSEVRTQGSKWNEPFVALDNEDAASTAISSVTVHPQRPYGYVEFDVTDAVCNWCKGKPNYGLLIWDADEDKDGREIRFYGKRYVQSNYNERQPLLIVQCEK